MKYQTEYILFDKEMAEYINVYYHNQWGKYTYCTSSYLDDMEGYKTLKKAIKARERFKKITNRYPKIMKITKEIIM